MFKTHFTNGNETQRDIYKQCHNKLTKKKKSGKKQYFEKEIQKHSGNQKKT